MMPSTSRKRAPRISVAVKITWALVVVLLFLLAYNLYSSDSPRVVPASEQEPQADAASADAEKDLPQASALVSDGAVPEVHTEQTAPLATETVTSLQASCHVEEHADYWAGTVLTWGRDNHQESAEACCAACDANAECNVWVWCGDPTGCGSNFASKECWLKYDKDLNLLKPGGNRGPNVPWVSGAKYTEAARAAAVDAVAVTERAEAARLAALRADTSRPLVFLDVSIKGVPVGRMEFVLFTEESPRAAENFRSLCTGEKGIVPEGREGAGKPYHFKGKSFYRIIDQFIDQTGAETESVFGGHFKDDEGGLKLKHDRKGLLSMANMGPDTNGSHFSIVVAPAPHLNGHYTIFGELVSGWEVAAAVNALAKGKPNNTAGAEEQAVITDSGQIR